jgi:hypothetical protein
VGGREQFGSRGYGPTVAPVSADASTARLRQLSSLIDEEMPDLLAASCLSRRSIEYVRHSAHEPTADTLAALELAMHLLDPTSPHGIAGWREIVTVEELAQLLHITVQDAEDRRKGRMTWQLSERALLVLYLTERRTRLAQSS